ncbi:ELWxxDGT repeat protein [Myxococcus sp. SDU36]|uniref:ELWxxDGT repeat protein n=1 Tax=Myxococcus sp. SDU36 TaxID=2831967 RepID=UPI002542E2A8|nr:ELWxxDGT repeat protein [Myxococcus sp. SDU36]
MTKSWRVFPMLLTLVAACEPPSVEDTHPSSDEAPARQAAAPRTWEPCGDSVRRLEDLHPGREGAAIQERLHGDGLLFFTADDGQHGAELWASSGTQGEGTRLLRDIAPGPEGSNPTDLTRVGDRVFFIADDGVNGRALWTSDGTSEGTSLVKRVLPVGASLGDGQTLVAYKGRLYFSAAAPGGAQGNELWTSDGTDVGTYAVADLVPGEDSSFPRRFAVHDGSLYFVINVGNENWLVRSEGGAAFTPLLKVFEDTVIFRMKSAGGRLFFLVDPDEGEATLHVTDGTAEGTRSLRFFPGQYPHDLVAFQGRLYFSAGEEAPEGEELWVSDGTVSGTRRVKDLRPGAEGSAPAFLTVLGDHLYFAADDGRHGRELWVSDGTSRGTKLFADLVPGTAGASPTEVTAIQGWLFFSAVTGHGGEPWVSNGTESGTRKLDAGTAREPRAFIRSGWDVFFTAEDAASGRELYALPFRPTSECDHAMP